jgi:hypothetical protein
MDFLRTNTIFSINTVLQLKYFLPYVPLRLASSSCHSCSSDWPSVPGPPSG